jgi:transcriptional regulator with XRE-family HTH domain
MNPKHPLLSTVRELRLALGDTQQSFAERLGLSISTVVRYELSRPPKGRALAQFARVADENGMKELSAVFQRALAEDLGAGEPRVAFRPIPLNQPSRSDDSRRGFVFVWYDGPDQKEIALEFRDAIDALNQQNEKPERRDAFRQALADFAKRAAKIRGAQ